MALKTLTGDGIHQVEYITLYLIGIDFVVSEVFELQVCLYELDLMIYSTLYHLQEYIHFSNKMLLIVNN